MSTRPVDGFSNWRKIKSLLGVCGGAAVIFSGVLLHKGDEKFYDQVVMPLVRLVDPETAHRLAILSLKYGLTLTKKTPESPVLRTSLWGLNFENPLGIAAGFDKNAESVQGLTNIGFSFVEIGSVTPQPQPGNSKPRVFRLSEDRAIINRYGFNSDGHEAVYTRLNDLRHSSDFNGVVGVNLGKNKLSKDPIGDYVEGVRRFADVADYFVVNVSSPNTPGLRLMQAKEELEMLLSSVNEERKKAKTNKMVPLLLKIAPDLTDDELKDIVDVVMKEKTRVDGIVISNTTITRNNLINEAKNEEGGLSGAPLTSMSTQVIATLHRLTRGELPIIGVGGIFDGEDAYAKIRAGASLVQIYTSFAYHGPPVVPKIKRELAELLERDGYKSISEAVGAGNKTVASRSR